MVGTLDPTYPVRQSLTGIVADGSTAVAEWTSQAHSAAGVPYENDYIFVFRCEDGRIAEVWEHLGRQAPPLPKD
jgi:ketosteroid isomerase-like protein